MSEKYKYKPRESGYPWLRIRTNLIDNPDFFSLSDAARAIYFELYLLAGKSDAGGLILAGKTPANSNKIAWILRRDESAVEQALAELEDLGWVELEGLQISIAGFSDEQGPSAGNKREEWAIRQENKRRIARGEEPIKPNKPEPAKEKEKVTQKEKEKQQQKSLKIKSIAEQSRDVQEESRVTSTPNEENRAAAAAFSDFEVAFLEIWNQTNGNHLTSSERLRSMLQKWFQEGVTLDHIKQTIQERPAAKTPYYLENAVIEITKRNNRRDDISPAGDTRLEHFRQLYREIRAKKQAELEAQKDAEKRGIQVST